MSVVELLDSSTLPLKADGLMKDFLTPGLQAFLVKGDIKEKHSITYLSVELRMQLTHWRQRDEE